MTGYASEAATFGQFVRQGGCWSYGAIVARWVQSGAGQNARGSRRSGLTDEKVSASKFAADAGVSRNTVLKYLRAWDAAAEAGHVPASSTLAAGEAIELNAEELPEWSVFYTQNSAPRTSASSRSEPMSIEEAKALTARLRNWADGCTELFSQLAAIDPVEAARVQAWADGYTQARWDSVCVT